ncbi:hypothetical protein [Allostreptomyces psammosilenae]|uniref:Uncharacterized protein n=1 Tax=Allostreptomyces psammosilenae TaxID=1892865 RepID=A0A852ZUW3_9ACTN|nr:hypothetical protein [Allostreptomyces psammosilenae]NYI04564.1 hypothetical protein [Allostreptomyces psammosilenae]
MTKAQSFAAVVALLAKAEALLAKAGQSKVEDRLQTLRGVYYGTTWSLDYEVESKRSLPGAVIRNAGFVSYTGHTPADPRPAFARTSVLQDLKDSQSIRDGARSVDIGHLLIGLETRTSITRALVYPEGGTGLEVVTWLGDLGGGAANLARRRAKDPAANVEVVFHNASSDYGVTDNLEGDAAAYMVAAGTNPGGPPALGGTVSDAVKAYLIPATSSGWTKRAAGFSTAIGATVAPTGITNAATLTTSLTKKLTDFGYWYAATRWLPTGELVGRSAARTCEHMEGAAKEIATVFVATLSRNITAPNTPIKATPPYPPPSSAGVCNSRLLQLAALAGN